MVVDRTPRLLIYGAGAVGMLLGGRLANAGWPVTLLARTPVAAPIQRHGLTIDGPTGQVTARVEAITGLDQLSEPPDIVLLTIKTYALEAALPDIERLASQGCGLLTVQNGVGSEERLLESPAIDRLAAGSLTVSVGRVGATSVRQEDRSGGLALAPVAGETPLKALAAALASSGLAAEVLPDYRAMKWSKLLLNILANATSAILALPPAAVYRDARLFRLERQAFLEALAVMRASRLEPVRLPGFNVPLLCHAMRLPPRLGHRLLAPRISRGRGDKRPSLWLDIERGRRQTEVDWLNGAVVAAGERLGIDTPVNRELTALVHEITGAPGAWSRLASQPDRLLRRVANP